MTKILPFGGITAKKASAPTTNRTTNTVYRKKQRPDQNQQHRIRITRNRTIPTKRRNDTKQNRTNRKRRKNHEIRFRSRKAKPKQKNITQEQKRRNKNRRARNVRNSKKNTILTSIKKSKQAKKNKKMF